MIQFQKNVQTDGRQKNRRTEGQMEGWTDPISLDPSGYHPGSNNNKEKWR